MLKDFAIQSFHCDCIIITNAKDNAVGMTKLFFSTFFSVIDTFNTQHNEKEKISRKLLQTFLSAVKVHAMMSFVINCTSFKAYRDQLKLTASNLWNRKVELVLNFKLISFIRHFGHGALKWKE